MDDTSSFHEALTVLYNAAVGNQSWSDALGRLASFDDTSVEALAVYAADSHTGKPVLLGTSEPRRTPAPEPEAFDAQYPVGGSGSLLCVRFARGDSRARSRAEQRVALVSLHLAHALRVFRRFERLMTRGVAGQLVLDSLRLAVFLLDAGGRVTVLNRAAAAIGAARDGFGLRDGALYSDSRNGNEALQSLIRKANRSGTAAPGHLIGVVRLSRPSGRRPYYAAVAALSGFHDLKLDSVSAAVLVIDPSQRVLPSQQVLTGCFGFTPREAELAAQLANGADIGECAKALRMSPNTARAHQRQIYRKTRTRRQAELVRLLADVPHLPAPASEGQVRPDSRPVQEPSSKCTNPNERVDGIDESRGKLPESD